MNFKKIITIVILIISLVFISIGISYYYITSPISSKDEKVKVEIKNGMGTKNIAKELKEKKLIRSEIIFLLEVKTKKINLKSATYNLSKNMNMKEIIYSIQNTKNLYTGDVRLTFKEGQLITDYAKIISHNTNNKYEDIINKAKDREYIKKQVDKYWFLNKEILDSKIYYPLEGYLAPNTYFFDNKDVKVEEIFNTMLKQTEKNLSPYKNEINKNINEYIIMASIVELEGTALDNRKIIAGIFENRLLKKMNLGSDVTTYYAFQKPMTAKISKEELASNNPYNTRSSSMAGKLPIGAICNPSLSSIEASINPTKTDYYYFVADKNKKIYYNKDHDGHIKTINELKKKGDWLW